MQGASHPSKLPDAMGQAHAATPMPETGTGASQSVLSMHSAAYRLHFAVQYNVQAHDHALLPFNVLTQHPSAAPQPASRAHAVQYACTGSSWAVPGLRWIAHAAAAAGQAARQGRTARTDRVAHAACHHQERLGQVSGCPAGGLRARTVLDVHHKKRRPALFQPARPCLAAASLVRAARGLTPGAPAFATVTHVGRWRAPAGASAGCPGAAASPGKLGRQAVRPQPPELPSQMQPRRPGAAALAAPCRPPGAGEAADAAAPPGRAGVWPAPPAAGAPCGGWQLMLWRSAVTA